jgi:integrase
LPSGRYQAKYRDDSGQYVPAPETFDAKADAEAWLAAKRTDLRRGVDIDEKGSRKTLAHWWPAMEADSRRRLKPSTVKYYDECWTDHVEPRFGRVAVSRIRPSDVDHWLGDLHDAGVSPSRMRGALGVLSRLCDAALRDRAIATNPASARSARIPASKPAERPVLTPLEIRDLHRVANTTDENGKRLGSPELALIVSVLSMGGLRIGECLALQRRDINLEAGSINVRLSVAEISGKLHLGGTKAGKERVVTLPAAVVAELSTYLAGVADGPEAWLFPSRVNKPRRYTNFRIRQWLPMVERFNADRKKRELPELQVMPHDLRSTCASLLIDAGASPKDVQEHLGHADITTTLNLYARVRPGRSDDLAARMDALLAEEDESAHQPDADEDAA